MVQLSAKGIMAGKHDGGQPQMARTAVAMK